MAAILLLADHGELDDRAEGFENRPQRILVQVTRHLPDEQFDGLVVRALVQNLRGGARRRIRGGKRMVPIVRWAELHVALGTWRDAHET